MLIYLERMGMDFLVLREIADIADMALKEAEIALLVEDCLKLKSSATKLIKNEKHRPLRKALPCDQKTNV